MTQIFKNFKKVQNALSSQQHLEAINILNRLLQIDSKNEMKYLQLRGEAYLKSEQYELGLIDLAKVVEVDNKNIPALVNFSAALIRCNRQPDAKDILEYILELDPENFDARINLCNVYQTLGKSEESLKQAFKAIEIRPNAAIAYNNLGTSLGELNLVEDSRQAFLTSMTLDHEFMPAIINLAQIEIKNDNYDEGIRLYEDALKNKKISPNQSELVKYYLGFSYLYQGKLDVGWENYEYGFGSLLPIASLRSTRKFIQPRWNGESFSAKKLLIWREQGLGDEIEFSTCLFDLVDMNVEVILECEPRLVSIFQRTFPKFIVRKEALQADGYPQFDDFDVQCPIGSLPRLFRKNLDSFKINNTRRIEVSKEKINSFNLKLKPYQNKILVGICWRSGLLSIQRNKHYTSIVDWRELLSNPIYQFINLQYGECEAELIQIEESLNIKILRWPELDLKNDLEDVLALIKNLDYVVTIGSAVSSLAGSVGTKTFMLTHKNWMLLGQEDWYPWFDSVVPLVVEKNQHLAEKIKLIPYYINSKNY